MSACCTNTNSRISLYDYVTFNQFRELREMLHLYCLNWPLFWILVTLLTVYGYFVWLGFGFLVDNIQVAGGGRGTGSTTCCTICKEEKEEGWMFGTVWTQFMKLMDHVFYAI
uniref:Uncharacterized protein n=1 Tax=Cacopsylla melanoneura TaxID=428564 RepID=A0A8D8RTU8_9HEMI